jgi:hypothetical protein
MTTSYLRRCQETLRLDRIAKSLIDEGRLTVSPDRGLVFANRSKTPMKAIGTPNRRGYLRTCITTKGKAVCLMVHRIVWISVNGVPFLGQQINHRDGVKTHNAISNLETATAAENNAHARSMGLWKPNVGPTNGQATVPTETVAEARRLHQVGLSHKEIGERLGLTPTYVRSVVAGRTRRVA